MPGGPPALSSEHKSCRIGVRQYSSLLFPFVLLQVLHLAQPDAGVGQDIFRPLLVGGLHGDGRFTLGRLDGGIDVFDAYSGIGTIGLIAARHVKRVISVEIVEAAVKDAVRNAKNNNIKNFNVYCDDASSFMVRMAEKKEHVDVLFMDPPRKGSDERFLNALLKLKPSRVVYVSCDPSTLARDVAYISQSYKIESIQPMDMFPQSFHVETVVSLCLRKK